jgi:hypothetical protein
MDYKKLGPGLGIFSIGLGLVEVAAPGRLARWLGVGGHSAKTVVGLFGARELLAGAMLLRWPAVSTNVWKRVVGDAMDLGAFGFVAGATILDVFAARALDEETGRTFPRAERLAAA